MKRKKIRILVLSSSFPRHKNDWWAQFILNIYKNFPKNKYTITVIAPHSPGARFSETDHGIKIIRFPYFYPYRFERLTTGEGILHIRGNILSKIQIPLFVLCETVFTGYHLTRYRYDVLHAHWILPQGLICAFMKKIFHIRVIVTVHGSDVFGLQKFNFLKKYTLQNVDHVTANSRATYDAVKMLLPNVSASLIPMGVDTEVFNVHTRSKRDSQKKIILAVGRLIRCKGYRYLLLALPFVLKKIKTIEVHIVGSGPEESSLRNQVRKLHMEKTVKFLGNLRHHDLSMVYSQSDIFVAPAVTDSKTGEKEGQGLAILEAMASGIPVVASKSGGIQYIVEDKKTGILVREKDFRTLAEKINYVLTHDEIAKKMKKNGLIEIKRKYSWIKIGESFDKLFAIIVT